MLSLAVNAHPPAEPLTSTTEDALAGWKSMVEKAAAMREPDPDCQSTASTALPESHREPSAPCSSVRVGLGKCGRSMTVGSSTEVVACDWHAASLPPLAHRSIYRRAPTFLRVRWCLRTKRFPWQHRPLLGVASVSTACALWMRHLSPVKVAEMCCIADVDARTETL